MLYMMVTYPFCSISHQQCILIMNSLKETFDAEDLQTLKKFVTIELDGQSRFNYPSDRKTSGMNMGQIIQIAIELRILTQAALDDEKSDQEDEEDPASKDKQYEIGNWMRFCKEKIEKIEKTWNRKLEDSADDDDD